ncbi:histidine kinase N-terminal 7TM domain-containing diguanylate cyclase [Kineococcus arenarius]|uniref:histidine kinase N-terminal 7TM domain-containing diguanylate cyclase n=1 Tax=unclassified Kineococcus TaxID=2621656 RepID=UPI003D7D9286
MQDLLAPVFALSAALNAATGVIAWRRRRATPAATALAGVCAGLALWSGISVPVHLDVPVAVQRWSVYCSFVGVLGCVVSLYLLARTVADPHFRPARRQRAVLVAVPVLVLAAVATDPWHHLVFTQLDRVGDPPRLEGRFGPLFWVHTAWCYAVLASAVAHLLHARRRAPVAVRRQIGSLLLGAGVPLAGNVAVVTRPDVFGSQDLTPLFFTVTALVDARAVLRQGLLRVVPVARAAVLETVTDAVVVVDAGGTVVDVNAAGRTMLTGARPDLPDPVGVPARSFLSPRALADLPCGHTGYALEYVPGLHLDVRITAIADHRGRALGRVVVARDVTEQVRTRQRLEDQLALVERLRAQLAEDSVRDPLTGLHNRRFLDTALATELERAARQGSSLGVLAVDVDRFKAVNDTHGHAAGDEVLVAIAGTLGSGMRRGDVAVRCGGEEFVVLLPGADARAVHRRAEELRTACAALRVPVGGGALVRPTVSVGTAVHPADGADAASLLAAADRALYAAKAAGRDQVVAADGLVAG